MLHCIVYVGEFHTLCCVEYVVMCVVVRVLDYDVLGCITCNVMNYSVVPAVGLMLGFEYEDCAILQCCCCI